MKRSLVIGCAALALAAGCGTASAQSKFDVVIGGDAYFQGAYVDQDRDQGLRKTEFTNRYRLVITPTAKADNGLEYGGRIRIRAANANRGVDNDRAFIFANGGFGTIQAGVINGLSDEYGIFGPNVEGIAGGPDNNTVAFYSGALPYTLASFRALESGDVGTKVVYLTPIFAGFQAGVSYTPKYGNANTSVDRVKGSTLYRDIAEVGGVYKNTFGDSGYATGTTGVDDQQVWTVGANYTTGPLILAANYTNAQGIDNTTFSADSEAELWQAGVTYTVAPGLTAGLEYNFLENKVAGVRDDAHIIMVDTRLAF
jgi:predicted porin